MRPPAHRHRRRRAELVALALAVLALAAAAAGSALAGSAPLAKAIKGTLVKKGSEPGNRLILDSVTGKEVSEAKLGEVAKATSADSADSATSADHAGTATTAANAGTVGGESAAQLKVSCPSGSAATAGVCIETGAARAQLGLVAAQAACTSAGGRGLPNPAQLQAFRAGAGAGLAGNELTNQFFVPTSSYVVAMATGAMGQVATATGAPFRCVFPPTN